MDQVCLAKDVRINERNTPKTNKIRVSFLFVCLTHFRNDVWRYNRAVWGHSKPYRWVRTLFRGFPLGAACAAATIALEEYYGVYKHHGHDDHGHAEHH